MEDYQPGPSTTNKNNVFKIGGHATKMFVAGNHLVGGGRDLDPNYDNVEVYINSLLPTPG